MNRTARMRVLALVAAALLLLAGCKSAAPLPPNSPSPSPTGAAVEMPAPSPETPPAELAVTPTAEPAATPAGEPAATEGAQAEGNAKDHVSAGEAALEGKNYAKAEREFKSAVATDPGLAAAQFGLGNAYAQQSKLLEARDAYSAALTIDPQMTSARANLGVVYYQLGQYPQAIEQYNAVLKSNPDDAAAMYLLAAVYLQQQDLEAAEPLLLKARELKPNMPEVYYGLGTLYKLKNQKDEAIANFEKFLQIGPGQDPTAKGYAEQELKELKGR